MTSPGFPLLVLASHFLLPSVPPASHRELTGASRSDCSRSAVGDVLELLLRAKSLTGQVLSKVTVGVVWEEKVVSEGKGE
jgi:hypothetical protein